jgi:hypothetical protein
MFIEAHEIIIGTSTKRETAKFSWRQVVKMAEQCELLKEEMPPIHTRETIGEEAFFNNHGSNYLFAAPNRNAGRSYSVDRALLDELRDHKNQDTYDGLINAGNAKIDFQAVAITNQGDATSVVLDDIRTSAIEFIESGTGDPNTFIAEWSSPQGSDPTDMQALAYANPNLGIRIPYDALMGQAIQSKKKGGEKLARFKTEIMCQKVHLLDPAIEPELWDMCNFYTVFKDQKYPNLAEHRRTVTLCLDVSLDGDHATLVAVSEIEGLYYCEVIKVWKGFNCTNLVRSELPDLVEMIRPRAFAWYPGGPAAAIAADLRLKPKHNKPWPPRNVKIIELKTEEIPAICMGLSQTVHSARMCHPGDEMLTQHIKQTQKLHRGDVWTFVRAGSGPVDATYALAGALHTNKTLPAPLKPVTTGRASDGEEIPF